MRHSLLHEDDKGFYIREVLHWPPAGDTFLVPCVLSLRNMNQTLRCSVDLLTDIAVAGCTCLPEEVCAIGLRYFLSVVPWLKSQVYCSQLHHELGMWMQQETDRLDVCPLPTPGFRKCGPSAFLCPVCSMSTYLTSFPLPFSPFAVCLKVCLINCVDQAFSCSLWVFSVTARTVGLLKYLEATIALR